MDTSPGQNGRIINGALRPGLSLLGISGILAYVPRGLDKDVLGWKSVKSDPTMRVGFAVSSNQSFLRSLKLAGLTVRQFTIRLPDEGDEEQVANPAKEQLLNIRQRGSRRGIAEEDVERTGAHGGRRSAKDQP